MFGYEVDFERPLYLLLLLLVPLLWWASFRSLVSLGRARRLVALALRTLVLLAIIFALAEVQVVRRDNRLAVLYLLDQSLSVPEAERQAMRELVNASILRHRRTEDYVGVIVFGRDAAIEVPPFDDDVQLGPRVESLFDPEYTDLAAAMRLAMASFPENAARRMVIASDGNENLGDALDQARQAAEQGVGIDVVPVRTGALSDVLVEKVSLPADIRADQPFDLRVVVENASGEGAEARPVRGRLIVSEQSGDQPRVVSDEQVTLEPGKNVFSVRQQIGAPGGYAYAARFVPDDPADDAVPQNNRATAFAYVGGKPQVLVIEDHENAGEHDVLVERLRQKELEITLRTSDQLFTDLPELQRYDTVVLANVPREHFSERQIDMLVRNTQQLGCGLVMLGGPNSFGAGGWSNTPLEEAMPVDFQIKAAKVVPRGALALVLHACEIAEGNHWQKVVAKESIRTLGPQDYCGVLHWNGTEQWLWRPGMRQLGDSRDRMLAMIDRMTPGDMPDFQPTMEMARRAMADLADAAIKHMIIISDGDPAPPSSRVVNALRNGNVTVSTVAIGAHGPAGHKVLADLAQATGGKYYVVNNPRALPRIFQKEARRVARPLIFEDERGFSPSIDFPNETVRGLPGQLPPITGFVLTTVKQNPLVEVALLSPRPSTTENNTILASWTYGLGRAVAFTSDAGTRWTAGWTSWEGYDTLFSQIIRYSMRPSGGDTNFIVASDVKDGQVEVVVTALDKDDAFLNFLDLKGMAIGPQMEELPIRLEQTAPGRYVGGFAANEAGSYFMSISPGPGQAPLRTGINIPYSAEYRRLETNDALLASLARVRPEGGAAGQLIDEPDEAKRPEALLAADPFRRDLRPAVSRQDVWPLVLLLGGCLFFFDVLNRRVTLSFAWIGPLAMQMRDRILRRPAPETPSEYFERLQRRKQQVVDEIEERRSTARFEPEHDVEAGGVLEEELAGSALQPTARRGAAEIAPSTAPQADEEESYTERLLKAKKKVWKERQGDQ